MLLTPLYFALPKFGTLTEKYSPQTLSVTATIVGPAVVIYLNSLMAEIGLTRKETWYVAPDWTYHFLHK